MTVVIWKPPTREQRIAAFQSGQFAMDRESEQSVGLVGWWPLAVHGGGTDFDYSGRKNHGTRTNGPTRVVSNHPKLGAVRALDFDGSDDYVDVATSKITGVGGFTVTAWIKTSQSSPRQTIVNQRATASPNASWLFAVDNSPAGKLEFEVYDDGTRGFSFNGNTSVNDGTWHFVSGIRENATDGRVYVDGISDGSGSGTAKSMDAVAVSLGRWNGDGLYFNGLIGDVRIYSLAQSSNLISQEYNHPEDLIYPIGFRTFSFPPSALTTADITQTIPRWITA